MVCFPQLIATIFALCLAWLPQTPAFAGYNDPGKTDYDLQLRDGPKAPEFPTNSAPEDELDLLLEPLLLAEVEDRSHGIEGLVVFMGGHEEQDPQTTLMQAILEKMSASSTALYERLKNDHKLDSFYENALYFTTYVNADIKLQSDSKWRNHLEYAITKYFVGMILSLGAVNLPTPEKIELFVAALKVVPVSQEDQNLRLRTLIDRVNESIVRDYNASHHNAQLNTYPPPEGKSFYIKNLAKAGAFILATHRFGLVGLGLLLATPWYFVQTSKHAVKMKHELATRSKMSDAIKDFEEDAFKVADDARERYAKYCQEIWNGNGMILD